MINIIIMINNNSCKAACLAQAFDFRTLVMKILIDLCSFVVDNNHFNPKYQQAIIRLSMFTIILQLYINLQYSKNKICSENFR